MTTPKYMSMSGKLGFNPHLHELCINKDEGIQKPEDDLFFWKIIYIEYKGDILWTGPDGMDFCISQNEYKRIDRSKEVNYLYINEDEHLVIAPWSDDCEFHKVDFVNIESRKFVSNEKIAHKWKTINSIEELKAFYKKILPRLRVVAKGHGYALAVHGSLTRDFDLVAIPWGGEHSDKNELAKDIQESACGFTMSEYVWEDKPFSRFATVFPICLINNETIKDYPSGLGQIDLSVIEFFD